jgi:hypothetical protein
VCTIKVLEKKGFEKKCTKLEDFITTAGI